MIIINLKSMGQLLDYKFGFAWFSILMLDLGYALFLPGIPQMGYISFSVYHISWHMIIYISVIHDVKLITWLKLYLAGYSNVKLIFSLCPLKYFVGRYWRLWIYPVTSSIDNIFT